MDLLEEIILQHGQSSPFKGVLANPTQSVEMENPLCGDGLKIEMKIEKGRVMDMAFAGSGCLISQAAVSLLIQKVKKIKKVERIKKFDQNTVFDLLGIKLSPSRIKCALLGLEALKKALVNY